MLSLELDRLTIYAANEKVLRGGLSCDGKYIYMVNGGIGSLTNGSVYISKICYVLSLDGELVQELKYDGYMSVFQSDYIFSGNISNLYYMKKSDMGSETTWQTMSK